MLQIKEPSFVTIRGRKIAYSEVCPPNPKGTILLLTGLASKRIGWYSQLEEFGRYYRTIALDNRDAGDSETSNTPYSIAELADDVAAALTALGVERTNVVGISMGGFISLELVLRHPQLVEKLVLVSTSAGGLTNIPASPRLWPTMLRRQNLEVGAMARKIYTEIMGPGYAAAHPQVMEDIVKIARYRPMSKEAYSRQLRACLTHNASNRLSQVRVPTLVIHGNRDPLVPFGNGLRLARRIPGARLLVYEGVGHIPIIEQAERFNRDVLNFLGN
ncbi:MAG TPA: alpha/beta fold hydrolase [Chloroflexia bacterium]|nr:alpha/beta fold hydrolase [Chloroflexia bacterium]